MTAIAAVNLSQTVVHSLSDSASSAGDVVYSPVGFIQPGVAKWANRVGGIPLLYPVMTVSVRLPTAGSRNCRIMAKLTLPTADITSPSTGSGIQPAPSKAYECLASLEMVFPERSTLAERNTLRSLVLSCLSTQITAGDLSPAVSTGSPLPMAISDFEVPY